MVKKILLGLVGIIAVLLIGLVAWAMATMPDAIHIERSVQIASPADFPFKQVNVMKNWEKWSPWYKMDPEQKMVYNEIAEGKGAAYSWDGKKTGKGTIALESVKPNEEIVIDLNFTEPFESHPDGGYKFQKEGDGTKVTWYYDEKLAFMNKVMMRMFGMDQEGMDKMLGTSFEEGLAAMKTISEEEFKASQTANVIQVPAIAPKVEEKAKK